MNLKCKFCTYVWNYTGNSKYYATCPMCMHKVKVKEYKEDEDVKS